MNVAWNPEVGADPGEQLKQLFALRGAEALRHIALNFAGYLERLCEQLATLGGEKESARAAVVGVLAALEKAALLERVYERDHSTRRDIDALTDRLLGISF